MEDVANYLASAVPNTISKHKEGLQYLGWDIDEQTLQVEKQTARECGITFVEHVSNCYRSWKHFCKHGILVPPEDLTEDGEYKAL